MQPDQLTDTPSPTPDALPKRNKKKQWERDQVLSDIESNRTHEKEKPPRQQFLRNLYYALSIRILQFIFFYLAVSLLLYAQDDSHSGISTLKEIYPLQIMAFAAAVFGISALSTCFDYAIFYALEVAWTGHYDLVYYAYSLHGVLGHVISLIITINLLAHMQVLQKLGSLHSFTTACLVVSLLYAVKEFYLRQHHKSLLQVRLKHKLAQMEEWSQILSKLGLSNVGTDDEEDVDEGEGNGIQLVGMIGNHASPGPSNTTFNPVLQGIGGVYQRNVTGRSDGSPLLQSAVHNPSLSHNREPSKGNHPIVQPGGSIGGTGKRAMRCHNEDDNYCCDCGAADCMSCLYPSRRNSSALTDDAETASEFDEEILQQKHHLSFWRRIHELKHGYLRVSSRFGVVTIRSRKQAESYGNKLYMHLTNGNTKPFTGDTICEVLREHPTDHRKSEVLPHVCHPLTPDRFYNPITETGLLDIQCHALRLFRCSETPVANSGQVSQGVVVNAVVTVFKEIQFSRASLQDLNNLHDTTKSVVDFIFGIFMLLLVQIILRVDISHVLAPLLTILFGLSFAFSPVLSNLFLSMAFVMFLLPFNVGDRVIIGKVEMIKGNVFEMSLMNTTILTRHNEKLRIPNHVLFHEHITNLSEGMVSTFEIPLVFALDGPLLCSQEKIRTFIKRIQKFAKEDNKTEWIDVIVFCDELNYGTNQVKYTFWCTHRAGYQEVIRCYNGHTRMLEEMRRVQMELDIHLQKGLKLL